VAERARGGRDWRKKLLDNFHASENPLAWLQRFREAAGVKDIEVGTVSGGATQFNFGQVFLAGAIEAGKRQAAATGPAIENTTQQAN